MSLLGPSRVGQVDDAQHPRRPPRRRRGRDPDRRPARQRREPRPARHRDGVPVLRALSAHDRVREHRLSAARSPAAAAAKPRSTAKVDRVAEMLGVADLLPAIRRSSPAASSSGSRSAARWSAIRRCSSSTNRCRTSTHGCGCACATTSRRCIGAIGSTIVYVTHDQAEAMSMSSRIAVFNKGALQQYAPPQEIYNRPANVFVAELRRRARDRPHRRPSRGERRRLRFETKDLALPVPAAALDRPPLAGRPVRLGLRIESLRFAAAGEPGAIPAVVAQTELAGPDLVVFATAGQAVELCCRTEGGVRVDPAIGSASRSCPSICTSSIRRRASRSVSGTDTARAAGLGGAGGGRATNTAREGANMKAEFPVTAPFASPAPLLCRARSRRARPARRRTSRCGRS